MKVLRIFFLIEIVKLINIKDRQSKKFKLPNKICDFSKGTHLILLRQSRSGLFNQKSSKNKIFMWNIIWYRNDVSLSKKINKIKSQLETIWEIHPPNGFDKCLRIIMVVIRGPWHPIKSQLPVKFAHEYIFSGRAS